MIAFYLFAAHMIGDFILQNRRQATLKFTDPVVRGCHVFTYTWPFIPIAIVYSSSWWMAAIFMVALAELHFLTDSRRFLSTLGDVIAWRYFPLRWNDEGGYTRDEWRKLIWHQRLHSGDSAVTEMPDTMRWPPPNEWPSMPILIDQTLHIVQIAVLAGIFLR